MYKENFKLITLFFSVFIYLDSFSQVSSDSLQEATFQKIQESHIVANVPNEKDFDSLLLRDLNSYFAKKYTKAKVKWEYLRNGPTQSGASYPKYYLWVSIIKNEKLLSEGALRIEAIDKIRFNITDYIDVKQIKDKSTDIYSIFPYTVCEKIEIRLL